MAVRAIQTLPAKAAPTKKGMRQPQSSSVALLSAWTVKADTPTASNAPISLAAEAEDGADEEPPVSPPVSPGPSAPEPQNEDDTTG